jgi:HK97 family phage prohead protease
MPWSKVPGSEVEECEAGQTAVVKDDDGEVEGCHDTEDEANDQIAALEASESSAMDALDKLESKIDDIEESGDEPEPQRKSAVGERRQMSFETKGLEIKQDEDDGAFRFEGYGAVFGNKDRGGDIIQSGAFERTIQHNDQTFPLVADHDLTMKSRVGVVYAEEDAHGVKVDAHVNTGKRLGREIASDIRHAQQHDEQIGMSFGYEVKEDEYDEEKDARLLKEIKTYEFSLTQIPMNPEAGVTGVKGFLNDESALLTLARKIAPILAEETDLISRLQKHVSGSDSVSDSPEGPSEAEVANDIRSIINDL